ncbi:MAG: hypothetical protein KDC48_19280, partial [Planctomycetes bacterium]|nr:hypothetical protein [Planctomycetota bacterium]
WVAYRAAVTSSAKPAETTAAWALTLGAAREFELLELIAVYEGWRHVGKQLLHNGAPQWVRAAVWNLGAYESHDKDGANQVLLQHGAEVLAWFRAYPQAALGKAATLREKLEEQQLAPVAKTEQLPPLEPLPFLVPQLDPPAQLAVFGDRKRAEPGVRYVHQVQRALGAVIVHGEADDLIVRKVLTLTSHEHADLRREAFATLGRLPGGLVPWAELLTIVDDADEPVARRRLATMALSFSAHPRAFFRITELAREFNHPGNAIALARLAEIGDATTDPATFAEDEAPAAAAATLADAARVFLARQQSGAASQALPTRHLLWRLAWLQLRGDPRAAAHDAAAARLLASKVGPQLTLAQAAAAVLNAPTEPSPFRGEEERQVQIELQRWIASQAR